MIHCLIGADGLDKRKGSRVIAFPGLDGCLVIFRTRFISRAYVRKKAVSTETCPDSHSPDRTSGKVEFDDFTVGGCHDGFVGVR
jgi:hypothetical protein